MEMLIAFLNLYTKSKINSPLGLILVWFLFVLFLRERKRACTHHVGSRVGVGQRERTEIPKQAPCPVQSCAGLDLRTMRSESEQKSRVGP